MTPELIASLLPAVIPAVFGLLGVIVGGLITALVEWWKVRRQERRDKIVREKKERLAFHLGARLLSFELRKGALLLGRAVQARNFSMASWTKFDYSVWDKYRYVLAAHLPALDFQRIADAAHLLVRLPSVIADVHGDTISDKVAESFAGLQGKLKEAMEYLEPFCDLPDLELLYSGPSQAPEVHGWRKWIPHPRSWFRKAP